MISDASQERHTRKVIPRDAFILLILSDLSQSALSKKRIYSDGYSNLNDRCIF